VDALRARVQPAPSTRELTSRAGSRLHWVYPRGKLAGGKDKLDNDYAKRLVHHMAILIAYEDSSLAHDVDRLMLAVVFLRNHCDMVLNEQGPKEVTPEEK